ncbi:MAG: heme-binding protein [Granulosicoccus sp.]|nr:heme-binding protein [Granulosicoccus sp.]
MITTDKRSLISVAAAQALIKEVVDHASGHNWKIAVVVVDPWGAVVAALRMDGVSAPVFDFAHDKAYTAGTLGTTTEAFQQRMASSDALRMGLVNRPRLCAWPGGLPLFSDGELVGGIGVSGAASDDDVTCAERARSALGLR